MKAVIHKTLIRSVLVSGLALLCISCSEDNDHERKKAKYAVNQLKSTPPTVTHKTTQSENHPLHWSYTGEGAPYNWGKINNDFITCSTGKSQSPIDITAVTVTTLPDIQFDYKASRLRVSNNGHTVKFSYDAGSSIVINGKRYKLLQFHFHSPSEHTIGGKAYDMVAHLVHQADDGQLAVVAIMMNVSKKDNTFLAQLWKNLPQSKEERFQNDNFKINIENLLPDSDKYFNYSGSLTTPPCSEGVNWIVMNQAIQVSAEQVKAFTDLFPASDRPVQPLNGRVIRMKN